ncbi:hypothetical protein DCCM_2379 [Desulfocucumis palustris]|uniref:RND related barrel-sandwich hybrid domain-containing protein n=1 Tax=Desulfocucumis palustris TaxID=1898651 RepID=A0A2L2XAZ9_9FIRM|nr:HlyD family efflux transporter periplasmic adaptor subunit [Desulfocucumis palustris]GBF33280.1 hypothetical protein DCCM_2379 [Desulfocucumis palustris]
MKKEVAGEGRRPLRRRNWAAVLILLACGVFILFIVATQIWQLILFRLINIEFLTPAVFNQADSVNCLLIKDETLINAPVGGNFRLTVNEGVRVKAGQEVARVSAQAGEGGAHALAAPRSGLVCTHIDNRENILKPAYMDALDISQLQKITENARPGEIVEKGQSVVKIVDNLAPLLIYLQAPEEYPREKLRKGGALTLLWNGKELNGRLETLKEAVNRTELIIRISDYPDKLVHLRNVDMELLRDRVTGFKVPSSALVEKNGVKGIYISSKQRVEWCPVEVRGHMDGEPVIAGTGLGAEIRYIKNPRWVRVGDRVE